MVVYTLNVEMWYLFSLIVVIACARGVYERVDNDNSVIITKKPDSLKKSRALKRRMSGDSR